MKILVLSETDADCGPMAAAFLNDYSPSNEVVSAGRIPSDAIDSMTVTVMKECLIDLSDYRPKRVDEFDIPSFDVLYECPEWSFPKTITEYRALRDAIKNETYLFYRALLNKSIKAYPSPNHPQSEDSR